MTDFYARPVKTLAEIAAHRAATEPVFDGPTLEQWIRAGYFPERYPGEQAFMRHPRSAPADAPEPSEHAPVADAPASTPAHADAPPEQPTAETPAK